jgi:hypothetical protein
MLRTTVHRQARMGITAQEDKRIDLSSRSNTL